MLALTTFAAAAVTVGAGGPVAEASGGYDSVVLADGPVAYWPLAGSGQDASGHHHDGTFPRGIGSPVPMPNGDAALVFDGASQYLTVPSSPAFSIPTTRQLTWEGWVRPSVVQFPNSVGGYVDWMGKCAQYSPTCEWEARLYQHTNTQGRTSRFSAYAFRPTAGLGAGADWQPATSTTVDAQRWVHVVAEYQTRWTPSRCSSAYPGSIQIWVDGVRWDDTKHGTTGCMSQYSVRPVTGTSVLTIGTMARDSWFWGAIGKVAVYDRLLSSAEISDHFHAMTGLWPSGTCTSTCTLAVRPPLD